MDTVKQRKKQLSDQDICTDALFSEKYAAELYNSFADTCISGGLHNEVTALLCEEHKLHSELYAEMKKRGWCTTPQIDAEMVASLKSMFKAQFAST